MRTTSPTFASFVSSCAWNVVERRTTFLYFAVRLEHVDLDHDRLVHRARDHGALALLAAAALVLGLLEPHDRLPRRRLLAASAFVRFGRRARGSRFFFGFGPDCGAGCGAASGPSGSAAASVLDGSSAAAASATGSAAAGSSAGSASAASATSAAGSASAAPRPRLLDRLGRLLRGVGLARLPRRPRPRGSSAASSAAPQSASSAAPRPPPRRRRRRFGRPRLGSSASTPVSSTGVVLVFFVLLLCHLVYPSPRSILTVRMRAISRLAIRSRAAVLERAGSRLEAQVEELLPRLRHLPVELLVTSAHAARLALKEISLALHELRPDRQLLAREAERLFGELLGDAGELEHDAARLDDGDPALRASPCRSPSASRRASW